MSNLNVQFDARFTGYVKNWIQKNYWRVAYRMEREDVMQEAGLVFAKLVSKYPNIDNDRWFMGIFKTSFENRMTDLAKKDNRSRVLMSHTSDLTGNVEDPDSLAFLDVIAGDLENEGLLSHKLENAPEEIKSLLSIISHMPAEMWDRVTEAAKANGTGRDMGNNILCSLLGKNPKEVNLIKSFEAYILDN